jgi:hypothetical protein
VEVDGTNLEALMGKAIAYLLAVIGGIVVVGWVAHLILGALFWLIVVALVVGGGFYLYGKAKRSIAPGTRNGNRIEAARQTYRMRNR